MQDTGLPSSCTANHQELEEEIYNRHSEYQYAFTQLCID